MACGYLWMSFPEASRLFCILCSSLVAFSSWSRTAGAKVDVEPKSVSAASKGSEGWLPLEIRGGVVVDALDSATWVRREGLLTHAVP